MVDGNTRRPGRFGLRARGRVHPGVVPEGMGGQGGAVRARGVCFPRAEALSRRVILVLFFFLSAGAAAGFRRRVGVRCVRESLALILSARMRTREIFRLWGCADQ